MVILASVKRLIIDAIVWLVLLFYDKSLL